MPVGAALEKGIKKKQTNKQKRAFANIPGASKKRGQGFPGEQDGTLNQVRSPLSPPPGQSGLFSEARGQKPTHSTRRRIPEGRGAVFPSFGVSFPRGP